MAPRLKTLKPAKAVVLMGLLAGAGPLGGCVALAVGAGATGAVAVAQERPVGEAARDFGLQSTVEERMFASSERLFAQVNTKVIEGRVLLTGFVPDYADRAEAERIAWTAPNVREVLNEIEVGESPTIGQELKDTWISTQLRFRLTTDFDVSEINYGYEIIGGNVYLLGIAQSPEEHDRVTAHAAKIPGVEEVVSHVLLKTDPRRAIYDDDLVIQQMADAGS